MTENVSLLKTAESFKIISTANYGETKFHIIL